MRIILLFILLFFMVLECYCHECLQYDDFCSCFFLYFRLLFVPSR